MVTNKLLSLIGSLTILLSAAASHAVTIEFSPATPVVSAGSPFDVEIQISGLGDFSAPSLGAFDLDVSFDPAIIGFNSISFGDPILGDQLDLFGLFDITGFDNSIPGIVDFFEISLDFPIDLDTLQPGGFTLATLTFDALSAGISSLDVTSLTLADSLGNLLDASVIPGLVTVESVVTVPEPSTLMLLLIGMVGMVFKRISPESLSAS